MARPMTACERGVWIDTEGHIESKPPPLGKYVIHITSMEREPIEDYCEGARLDGVTCVAKTERKPPHRSRAFIFRAEDVAKEIMLTQNYIRTKKKKEQIQRFINIWKIPRRKTEARQRQQRVLKILGII